MKHTNQTINFVMNIDTGYIQQSVVTISSILLNLNHKNTAHFYVFFKDYISKPKEYKLLEDKYDCQITCINTEKFDKLFANFTKSFKKNYWISLATFYRLLMFKFLPPNIKIAFYIDADAIVDGDLSILYEKFIKNNWFFASVVDVYFLKKWSKNKKYYSQFNEFKKLINDRFKYPYFCAGFYIANIEKCKEKHTYEQMIKFLQKNPDIKQADQDALNAIFSQKYSNLMTYLHPSYDVFITGKASQYLGKKYYYSKSEIVDAYEHPIVLHFNGGNKPWNEHKRWCCRGARKWWYYHDKSPASLPHIKLHKKD